MPASVLYVVSMILTSFCYEYYQFFLAQAVLGGICNGIIVRIDIWARVGD